MKLAFYDLHNIMNFRLLMLLFLYCYTNYENIIINIIYSHIIVKSLRKNIKMKIIFNLYVMVSNHFILQILNLLASIHILL